MALIVEVVDPRGGPVKARIRIDGAPVSVGRGYDNDLILDDAYVDARHARIRVGDDGAVEIEDLGSINGLVTVDGGDRVPRVAARPGTQVRVGRTILRFRDPAEPVPPALRDAAAGAGLTGLVDRGVVRAVVCLSAVACITWFTWLGSYDREAGSTAAAVAVFYVLIAALWAGAWSIASRVTINRFHFAAHSTVVALITIPALLFVAVDAWTTYLFPDNPVSVPAAVLTWAVLFTASFALHLRYSSTMDRRRRWRVSALTVGALGLMTALLVYAGDEAYSDVPEFYGVVKPFAGRLLPAIDVAEFGNVVSDLTSAADELATE